MHSSIQGNINDSHRFEALFTHASMGIIILHNHGTIQSVNPFALNFFGYTNEELTNRPVEVLIPQRFHKNHVNHRTEFSKNSSNRPMGEGMDLYAVKKDGTEFPVEVSLGKCRLNSEEFIIAFINDITVRKKAEKEINKLNDELEETVRKRTWELTNTLHQLENSKEELSRSLEKEKELGELKSRFVSMASHEFRTPLSTILSSAYLLEKYTTTEDQPKREKHLQRIFSSVNTLTDILNDFLSLGKIEEGKIQVRNTYFNIEELIRTIVGEMKNNLKKQQKIRYTHSGSKEVFLDASLMKHIVMNLLSNASKFSSENSCIDIDTFTQNQQFILSVKDHGIGISTDDQKHLMERFFRGANAGNIQGTGLGLHIVSKYAELMNGSVDCKSELEKGTNFIITFNTKIS